MRGSLLLAAALMVGTCAITVVQDATAQSRRAVRQMAEGSMVLTGQIDIGTEGQVEAFELDHADKVASDLAAFVDRSVRAWRFEPILRDGKAIRGRTFVSIGLIAKAGPDGRDLVTLQAANFERYDPQATDSVTGVSIPPPRFPTRAVDMRGSGEVLLLIQVGADGTVMDVVAEQVNLRTASDERQMRTLRDLFAAESVRNARNWTFRPPTSGQAASKPHWTVRVPVNFAYTDESSTYGQWKIYIPGPKAKAAWRAGEEERDLAGLLPQGGIYMADVSNGPRLLTPLGG
jgi:hypothetical protein